ncbi:Uncharacterised protein [Mycobacteroides abscessus subsp. abscessus]|nr:Uncharacterised protein [Mycobacteroides abscessus subsp. abscessus]
MTPARSRRANWEVSGEPIDDDHVSRLCRLNDPPG